MEDPSPFTHITISSKKATSTLIRCRQKLNRMTDFQRSKDNSRNLLLRVRVNDHEFVFSFLERFEQRFDFYRLRVAFRQFAQLAGNRSLFLPAFVEYFPGELPFEYKVCVMNLENGSRARLRRSDSPCSNYSLDD